MAALLLHRYSKSCKHIKVSPLWTLISRNRNGASGNLDNWSSRIIQRKLDSCSYCKEPLKHKSGVTLPSQTNREIKALYAEVRKSFIVLSKNVLYCTVWSVITHSFLQLNRPLYPRILGLTRTLHSNQHILNSFGLWKTLGECPNLPSDIVCSGVLGP